MGQQERMKEVLESAAQLKCRILCPQNVIAEFVYVLDKVYGVETLKIRTMVSDFLEMTGVEILHELDYKTLFTLWPEPINDFADAIIASIARLQKNALIVTFDKKLIAALRKMEIPAERFLKHK